MIALVIIPASAIKVSVAGNIFEDIPSFNGQPISEQCREVWKIISGQGRGNGVTDCVKVAWPGDHVFHPASNGLASCYQADTGIQAGGMEHHRPCCAHNDEINLRSFINAGQARQTGQSSQHVFHPLTEQRFSQVHRPHSGSVIAGRIHDLRRRVRRFPETAHINAEHGVPSQYQFLDRATQAGVDRLGSIVDVQN